MRRAALAALLSSFLASAAAAQIVPPQNSKPLATAKIDTIPAPKDIAYPGTMQLTVDASDVTRAIFKIHQHVPVPGSGDFVMLYPKWLPGHHSPSGQINKIAGFRANANGQELKWVRDDLDVYAFHIDVPAGVNAIDIDFQYVSPTAGNQGRIVATPDMASIQWISNSLYPAGYYVRQIPVQASVIVPQGWQVATALRPSAQSGNRIDYPVTSYEILLDSPLIAGAHYRQIPLSDDVFLDVIADTAAELDAKPEQIAAHKRLVEQAVKLFGAEHYDHYNFLLTISDYLGGIGLEHHRSSEDGVDRGYFTDWDSKLRDRNLLPHEYTHSWNGKYRRGADLWTPDYRTPMQDSLLWVYEGQTQFWGIVLAARSGLITKQQALDTLASLAARLDNMAGRKWRPLSDTTDDPIIAQRRPKGWINWQRQEDYYNEGALIWLDADSLIRQLSGGARSMDDFARAFFGVHDRDWGEMIYTFDDIVKTLNQVQPHDWAGFLHARLDNMNEHAPLDGFTRGGYQLIYTNTPTETFKSNEKARKSTDLSYSLGIVLDKDSAITEVGWDTPAFNAGLTVGTKLIALNDRSIDTDQLKAAIKAKKSPLKLLVKTGDNYRTIELNYDGGLRYPALEKTNSGPSSLDALLTAKP